MPFSASRHVSPERHALSEGLPSKQRRKDRLKGFAYFETFDEVFLWCTNHVDPVQRSNVPLLPRSLTPQPELSSNVMLIHDYKGNYQDYEACQGTTVSNEKYSCQFLQHVETFVYFSHKLVTIPPPTWTNTCHRHGVKALGTFIVEPGFKYMQSILQRTDEGFVLAHRLADMATCYGFDGWLINIEAAFPLYSWGWCDKLVGFLEQLKAEMGPDGKVVWYDALTVLNIVWYQNSMNALNLRFAQAAGSILTNYAWTPALASTTKSNAELHGIDPKNVYVGIDVWAQNEQHGRNKRVTYPIKGGGGTFTGEAVSMLAGLGLGSGIFAPAWAFEHFSGHGSEVERAMWTGQPLPPSAECSCKNRLVHSAYQSAITKYSESYVSGSDTFFHTDYKRAFSSIPSTPYQFAHLGQTSPQPMDKTGRFKRSLSPMSEPDLAQISCEVCDSPSRCSIYMTWFPFPIIDGLPDHKPIMAAGSIVLHRLAVKGNTDLVFEANYRKPHTNVGCEIWVSSTIGDNFSVHLPCGKIDQGTARKDLRFTQDLTDVACGVTLVFLGEPWSASYSREADKILELFDITIKPRSESNSESHQITDAWVERRSDGDLAHDRLVWKIDEPDATAAGDRRGVPYSKITGPFEYFLISSRGKALGRAYALEFILWNDEYDQDRLEKVQGNAEFEVVGYGFDGTLLATKQVPIPDRVEVDGDDGADGADGEGWTLIK